MTTYHIREYRSGFSQPLRDATFSTEKEMLAIEWIKRFKDFVPIEGDIWKGFGAAKRDDGSCVLITEWETAIGSRRSLVVGFINEIPPWLPFFRHPSRREAPRSEPSPAKTADER